MGADAHLTRDMSEDGVSAEDIHGYVCDKCARTHCSNSRGCTCHAPGCSGNVAWVSEVIDA